MPRALSPVVATVVAILSGVIWSLGAVHVARAHADAFQYLIWRSVAIILVLEVVARIRRAPSPTRIGLSSGRLMWLTSMMLLVASIAFVYAVSVNGAAQSAFLASMTPLFAVVISHVVLGEHLTGTTVLAVGLGLAGLVIMVGGNLGGGSVIGSVSAVASSVGFAVYTVCVRSDRSRDWSPVLPGYALVMIGICAAVTLAKGRSLVPGVQPVTLALIHGGLYIVVGTLLFNLAARTVPAVHMTVYAQAEMVCVPVWGLLLLNEHPAHRTIAGGLVVFAAITINAVWGGRQALEASVPDGEHAVPAQG